MKHCITILIFVISGLLNAQESDSLRIVVDKLWEQSENVSPSEKLLWLDSIASTVYRKPGFNYDSIAKLTIRESILQDTLDIAAYHIVSLMNNASRVGNVIKADSIFNSFAIHIPKLKSSRRIANYWKAGGLLHFNMDEFDTSLDYYDLAMKAAIKTTDSQAIGEIFMGQGMVYFDQGKVLLSSRSLQESIPFFKATGSTNAIINVKNVMTSLYANNGFYEQAEVERSEAIALATEANHHLFLSQIYYNESVVLRKQGKLEERISKLEKALNFIASSRYKNYYKPIYLSGMVIAQAEMNHLSKADEYMELLELEPRKEAPGQALGHYKEAQMRLALANKNYNNALDLGMEFLEYKNQTGQNDGLEQAHLFMAESYEAIGNFKKANGHLNQYNRLNDSLKTDAANRALSYYQTLYETEKRDAKIELQQADISLFETKNKIKNQWIIIGGLGVFFLFILLWALRSRNFASKKQKMQQEFAQNLLVVQEEERKSIAKELHDGVGQDLLLIKNSFLNEPKRSAELIDKSIDNIRAVSQNLHPVELEKFGLTKAIVHMVEMVGEVTSIFMTEDVENIDESISKENGIYLYRIIQECINNIIKHSQATASKVTISDDENSIRVTIKDNGKGFNVLKGKEKSRSLGLKSLVERVDYLKGKIEFESKPNVGTTVVITLSKE